MKFEEAASVATVCSVRRVAAVLAATVVMGLALAACGSGGQQASGSGASSDGRTKITLLASPVFSQPAYLAAEKGLFAAQGLDATVKVGTTPDAAIPQLLNGQATFAATSAPAVVTAISRHIPVKLVLGFVQQERVATQGVIAKRGGAVKSLADLTGKKVGVLSLRSLPELATRAGITLAGGDGAKTSFVEIPLNGVYQAVASGNVDAAYALAPFFDDAPSDKFVKLPNPAENGPLLGAPAAGWVASGAYIDKHPDVIDKFRAAMTRAYQMGNQQPDLLRQMDREHSKRPANDIAKAHYPRFGGTIALGPFGRLIGFMDQFGFVQNPPAAKQTLAPGTPTR